MNDTVVWLHEKAMRQSIVAPDEGQRIHIWDDAYYRRRGYSLKRLVFIYETLCLLPVKIFLGDTLAVFKSLSPQKIIIPYTVDSEIQKLISQLEKIFNTEIVHDQPFVELPDGFECRRFFKYWKKAQKTAFENTEEKH